VKLVDIHNFNTPPRLGPHMDNDFGTLAPLVKVVGTVISAAAAIGLAWRGRTSIEPSEEDIPGIPQKVGGLLTAIALALIWSMAADSSHYNLLVFLSVSLGILTLLALLCYGFLIGTLSFRTNSPANTIIGGFALTPYAKAKLEAATAGLTVQQLVHDEADDPDRVWDRKSRSLAKQVFVLSYLLLVVSGSISISCASIIVLLSKEPPTNPPKVVLIDSSNPALIYDRSSRAINRSNAFDIKADLKDLPIQQPPILVPSDLDWHGDDEVIKHDPALIIIHLSAFYKDKESVFDSDKKFRNFLENMAKRTHSNFLVYTRGLPPNSAPELEKRWLEQRNFMQSLVEEGRLQIFEVTGHDDASFKDPSTAETLKLYVRSMLGIK
jgi:hypothetical protein